MLNIADQTVEIDIDSEIPLPKISIEKRKKVTLPDVLEPKRYHPVLISFKVEPEHVAKLEFKDPSDQRKKQIIVHHIFPKLSEYQGGLISDAPNPRKHLLEALKGSRIAKEIENTLKEKPELFHLYNRGSVVLCDSFFYDPKTETATIKITNPDHDGIVDGGSSDRVVAKVQRTLLGNRNLSEINKDEMPKILKLARYHLEIIENFDDKDKIVEFTESRNSAQKVKSYSLEDLKGSFDFIKNILESNESKFRDKIGYDENSLQDTSILEVLALLTLFHPEFNHPDEEGKLRAPIVAYASKGKLDSRLLDEELLKGYQSLVGLLPEILGLHDYVYSTFDKKYAESTKTSARLGRRPGFESLDQPYVLPLTNTKTNYIISNGILYPLLNAFRALISYDKETGMGKWKRSPFAFWDQHGSTLVRLVIEQLTSSKTPNMLGKDRLAYINLYREARLLLIGE